MPEWTIYDKHGEALATVLAESGAAVWALARRADPHFDGYVLPASGAEPDSGKLVEAFERLGLSESAAQHAAAGRDRGVFGLRGQTSAPAPTAGDALEGAFVRLGLSESAARAAATGRPDHSATIEERRARGGSAAQSRQVQLREPADAERALAEQLDRLARGRSSTELGEKED